MLASHLKTGPNDSDRRCEMSLHTHHITEMWWPSQCGGISFWVAERLPFLGPSTSHRRSSSSPGPEHKKAGNHWKHGKLQACIRTAFVLVMFWMFVFADTVSELTESVTKMHSAATKAFLKSIAYLLIKWFTVNSKQDSVQDIRSFITN